MNPIQVCIRVRPRASLLGRCTFGIVVVALMSMFAAGFVTAQDGRSILTPYPLGPLTGGSVSRDGTLDTNRTLVFYRFEVTGFVRQITATNLDTSIGIGFSSTSEVQFFRDANNDGLPEEISPPASGIDRRGWVSLWLEPGTYYVRVKKASHIPEASYRLTLTQTPRPESRGVGDNHRSGARPLTLGQSTMDFVGTVDPVDYLRFEITGAVTEVTPALTSHAIVGPSAALGANLDFNIIRQPTPGGPEEIIATGGGNFVIHPVSVWLDPGVYYIRVESSSSNGNPDSIFDLVVNGAPKPESPGNGDNGPFVARAWPGVPVREYVGINDLADYYLFEVQAPTHWVTATLIPTLTRVLFAPQTELVLASTSGIIRTENSDWQGYASLSNLLAPGLYTIGVRVRSGPQVNNVYEFGLGGVVPPQVSVIGLPEALLFGDVPVGSTAVRTLFIVNSGAVPLRVTGITYPPGFSGPFSGTIAAGARQAVAVTFAPTAVTTYSGQLTVASDAARGVSTVPISGAGSPVPIRALAFTPSGIAFGEVELGRLDTRVLTLRNTGNTEVQISGLTVPAPFSGGFVGSIAAGGTTNISIAFAPLTNGVFSENIVINADVTSPVMPIPLSGTGIPIRPRILELYGALQFGGVEMGLTFCRGFVMTNSGEGEIRVAGIILPPGFSGRFSGTIPAHQGRSVSVCFSPSDLGAYGGEVEVLADNNGGEDKIAIFGNGTPNRVIALSSLSFSDALMWRRTTNSLVISNLGSATLTVTRIDLPPGYRCTFSGPIPGRSHLAVPVIFHPTEAVSYDGLLTVVCDANGGVTTTTVSGTGLLAALQPSPGTYSGLYHEENIVRAESSGCFKLTVDGTGGFSTTLVYRGKKASATGRFGFTGETAVDFQFKGLGTLTATFRVDPERHNTIRGNLVGPGWEAIGFGVGGGNPTLGQTPVVVPGRYTLIIPGWPGDSTFPEGHGFATATVDSKGAVKLAGKLADGVAFTAATQLDDSGACPFYHRKASETFLGWLTFGSHDDRDLDGSTRWIREGATSTKVRLYPAGFGLSNACVGFRYVPPVKGTPGIAGFTNGVVHLSGLNLPEAQNVSFSQLKDKILPTGAAKLSLKLSRNTGMLSGYVIPAGSTERIKFLGVLAIVPDSVPFGCGYFLRSNASGLFRVDFQE